MALNHICLLKEDTGNPYSDMVIVDNNLYLSGLIALDLETQQMLNGSIEEETKIILENLSKILVAYGSDMEHVIRVDVLLRDFSERDLMNEEYVRHFHHLPARLCYGDVGLHGVCKVEMAVIAQKL